MESGNTLIPILKQDDLPRTVLGRQLATQFTSAQEVMQTGLSWILTLGIQPDMPFYLKKNLSLINGISFASLMMALPGTLILLLAGFNHTFSLLVSGMVALCLILTLNRAQRVTWSMAIFAFYPPITMMCYLFIELNAGGLQDLLIYILLRQGLCLSLLIPVIIYGFEKAHRGMLLGIVALIFLGFEVTSMKLGESLFAGSLGMSQGLFSILSLLQLIGLAGCVLHLQSNMLNHEQQVRLSNEKLRHLAIRDGMTNLFNHTFMEGLIADAINRSKRSKGPLSLLMIDVDHFKHINDSFGHNTGDDVLVQLARLLKGNKRSTDYLGRWGGDELVLLLTDTNLEGASRVAEKLRLLVDNHQFPGQAHLSISLGATEYHESDTLSDFIGRADACLYKAKQLGRNQVMTGADF